MLAAISNTDYEGEIKNQGDKVIIRTKPTITIKDYRADGLLEVERPSSNIVKLPIDKGKYFNLILDDVIHALEEGRSPILLTERKDHLDFFAERLAKVAVVLGITLGLSITVGRVWGLGWLLLPLAAAAYVHLRWLPKHGVNGWTGEPRDRYLALVAARKRGTGAAS